MGQVVVFVPVPAGLSRKIRDDVVMMTAVVSDDASLAGAGNGGTQYVA
ncbi:hypothetical protein PCO82_12265 [Pectobacteriaceae bacterium CE90]|nr:hypothetical protein [Prodigiosinella sp. LS101]WJV55572.1 hypothetical protein PCO85_09385 [Prodigiosinella sp. LS101]WJV59933.1 hypothetical protein PCO84_09390 [Pectobacteriaceae bacterium C111]WJY13364.1 hypothetical protein PCO82_12265 [Pectobacteriaceae bacterium CE90]